MASSSTLSFFGVLALSSLSLVGARNLPKEEPKMQVLELEPHVTTRHKLFVERAQATELHIHSVRANRAERMYIGDVQLQGLGLNTPFTTTHISLEIRVDESVQLKNATIRLTIDDDLESKSISVAFPQIASVCPRKHGFIVCSQSDETTTLQGIKVPTISTKTDSKSHWGSVKIEVLDQENYLLARAWVLAKTAAAIEDVGEDADVFDDDIYNDVTTTTTTIEDDVFGDDVFEDHSKDDKPVSGSSRQTFDEFYKAMAGGAHQTPQKDDLTEDDILHHDVFEDIS